MKKFLCLIGLVLLFGCSNKRDKTRRINITCDFKAVAKGYKDLHYSSNMVMTGNGNILNDDGSFVDNELALIDVHDKFIQGTIDNGFEVYVYDGKNYSSYVFNKYYISPLNSGNMSCVIDSGWKK